MGQQQLLLVILVTILVGIATVVAINVFGTAAEQGNRDAVRQDLLTASAGAQAIWARPASLAGVGGNFADTQVSNRQFFRLLGIPGSFTVEGETVSENEIGNENGTYALQRTQTGITITAQPATYASQIVLRVERAQVVDDEAPDDPWNIWIVDGDDTTVLSGVAGT